mmetsp:Transcript_98786/g.156237  ORF Transcript_98786/g.156237 Transcript_98786/m.156237 type:complete len:184 (+) Transcript_98786:60-611(+)|eukprot:CAMPEP_0169124594 /NCGR_PEP_ID=MMETSP1015-20121227/34409_1 /TAXON_ID=342587 /ORGANISM="Karlodinium micrum, Strain CCMP2283" /LENGTH=183 /DNA_ID=CAMNT_0009188023 /DNA_START=60 /DNA_END=611 /DNA_ORIENTATION=+
MDALKKKAAAATAYASEKAVPLATQAKDKLTEAKDTALSSDMVAKHSDKIDAAKEFGASAMKRAFMPSQEMQAFITNPKQEDLLANPELLFQGIALLSAARHPKAAMMNAALSEGMDRAAKSEKVEQVQQEAAHKAIGSAVSQATDGVVKDVPPEVSQAALKYIKDNPQQAMDLMKMAVAMKK